MTQAWSAGRQLRRGRTGPVGRHGLRRDPIKIVGLDMSSPSENEAIASRIEVAARAIWRIAAMMGPHGRGNDRSVLDDTPLQVTLKFNSRRPHLAHPLEEATQLHQSLRPGTMSGCNVDVPGVASFGKGGTPVRGQCPGALDAAIGIAA